MSNIISQQLKIYTNKSKKGGHKNVAIELIDCVGQYNCAVSQWLYHHYMDFTVERAVCQKLSWWVIENDNLHTILENSSESKNIQLIHFEINCERVFRKRKCTKYCLNCAVQLYAFYTVCIMCLTIFKVYFH